jgi:hypothetical protein
VIIHYRLTNHEFESKSPTINCPVAGAPHIPSGPNPIYRAAKNATDLMQIVDFTVLLQVANKLYQAC